MPSWPFFAAVAATLVIVVLWTISFYFLDRIANLVSRFRREE